MPIVKAGPYDVDYAEAGTGPSMLLLHSSAAGNRQWRRLMEERAGKNRTLAVNLFGYGATSPWPNERPLTLEDEANLVAAVAYFVPDPIILVGHSLGGAVAAAAAHRLGERVSKLILFEPILFYLLQQSGEPEAFVEMDSVLKLFQAHAARGDWDGAATIFIDYWNGPGAWEAMDDDRRLRILRILPPLVHEWGMVGPDAPPLAHWAAIKVPVHYLYAADTRRPSRALATLLRREMPHWNFHEIETGGHTAPITRPDLVNPVIAGILDGA